MEPVYFLSASRGVCGAYMHDNRNAGPDVPFAWVSLVYTILLGLILNHICSVSLSVDVRHEPLSSDCVTLSGIGNERERSVPVAGYTARTLSAL